MIDYDDDQTYDEAESTRLYLARLRDVEYVERLSLIADAMTPYDEYKGTE